MDAFEEYKTARADFDVAEGRYREASKDRTEAINRLNDAQKKFDEWVAGVKSNAPNDSDWRRRTGEHFVR